MSTVEELSAESQICRSMTLMQQKTSNDLKKIAKHQSHYSSDVVQAARRLLAERGEIPFEEVTDKPKQSLKINLSSWCKGIPRLYLSWRGRIGRLEFFLGSLLYVIPIGLSWWVFFGVLKVADMAGITEYMFVKHIAMTIFQLLLIVTFLWAPLVLHIKRLHDVGLSGWWLLTWALSMLVMYVHRDSANILAALIALSGFFMFIIILYLVEGTDGPNRFGRRQTSKRRKARVRKS